MKISDSNLNGISSPAQQGVQSATSGNGKSGASRAADNRDDRVTLSSLSNTLKSLTTGSPEREAWVGRLSSVYQSGNYSIDSAAVSASLVADAMGAR